MSYHEVDELVKRVYGHDPEIVPSEEWGNDEEHSITVDGELDKRDLEKLDKFIKTGRASYGITRVLLNALAKAGHIEKGEYLVSVIW